MSEAKDVADALLAAKAQRLAESAHTGQVDKAGRPYIEHVSRVAAGVAGGVAKAVAWLHDVMEDTETTEAELMAAGMPREVIEAVEAITHRPHERRSAYYARVRSNPYALLVKRADVADNSDPSRLTELDDATRERLVKKYMQAGMILDNRDA